MKKALLLYRKNIGNSRGDGEMTEATPQCQASTWRETARRLRGEAEVA